MDRPMGKRLSDLAVAQFLEAVGSDRPTPGGGAAAALTGALGAALAEMVAGLTVGRGRYAAAQAEMAAVQTRGAALKAELLTLADADATAYDQVCATAHLPADTEDARAARAAARQAALKAATESPLACAAACVEAVELAGSAAAHGNINAAGDAAAAAILAHAALQVTVRNIRLNLRGIPDKAFCRAAAIRAAELLAAGDVGLARALAAADGRDA